MHQWLIGLIMLVLSQEVDSLIIKDNTSVETTGETKQIKTTLREDVTSTQLLNNSETASTGLVTPTLMFQNITKECFTTKVLNVAFSVGFTIYGVTANLISIRILYKIRTKNSSSFLLSILAIWDSFTLIIRCIIATVQFMGRYIMHPTMQYLVIGMYAYGYPCFQVSANQSAYVIVLVTIHRFIAICYPHKASEYCNVAVAKKQLALISFLVTLIVIPIFLIYRVGSETDEFNRTVFLFEYTSVGANETFHLVYPGIIFIILTFFGPLLLLSVLVIYIIRAVKIANKNRAYLVSKPAALQDITKMLVPVVVVFIVCQIWTKVRRFAEIAQVKRTFAFLFAGTL